MLLSYYLLAVLYTNTMGLIILAKCKPFIRREIESKGYMFKEEDVLAKQFLYNALMFFVVGYFLKKAFEFSSKEYNIDEIIEEWSKKGKIVLIEKELLNTKNHIKPSNNSVQLSRGRYQKPIEQTLDDSMYTEERDFCTQGVDENFWSEENEKSLEGIFEEIIVPYLAFMCPNTEHEITQEYFEEEKENLIFFPNNGKKMTLIKESDETYRKSA